MLAGAGLGDDARLAHPLREQRLADRVVDLVRAGVVQVLALEPDVATDPLRDPLREVERARPADVVAQQVAERLLERRVVARLEPGRLELVERRDERLGHVAAAVGAEPPLDRVGGSCGGALVGLRDRAEERLELRRVLPPGSASVPLAVSTANGRIAAIPSPTLSGVSPPERTSGTSWRRADQVPVEGLAGAAAQLGVVRVEQVEVDVEGAQRRRATSRSRTCTAFITRQPVRRAASSQYAGPSSPCSWSIESEQASAIAATSSSGRFTNTPVTSAPRASAGGRSPRRPAARTRAGSARGRSGRSPRRRARRRAARRRVRDAADLDPGHAVNGRSGTPLRQAGTAGPRPAAPRRPAAASRPRATAGARRARPSTVLRSSPRKYSISTSSPGLLSRIASATSEFRAMSWPSTFTMMSPPTRRPCADLGPPGAQPGLVGRTAVDDVLDQRALVDRQVEVLARAAR